jgi:hypothetical protein
LTMKSLQVEFSSAGIGTGPSPLGYSVTISVISSGVVVVIGSVVVVVLVVEVGSMIFGASKASSSMFSQGAPFPLASGSSVVVVVEVVVVVVEIVVGAIVGGIVGIVYSTEAQAPQDF